MARVSVEGDALRFGEHLLVSFQRTIRVPEGTREFPLPPSFGRFPIQRLDVGDADAGDGMESIEVVLPLRRLEALWIGFEEEADWRPHAVMIGAGGINAVTGEPWEERLSSSPQNYIVCPDQLWLDGINAGDGFVRQFVTTPLGSGLSVGEQLGVPTPAGGLHITVFAPKPGRFPDREPPKLADAAMPSMGMPHDAELMSLGAGGKIGQKLYPDAYGRDTWEAEPFARATVHLLNSAQFHAATGRAAPPSPMDAQTYERLGLPWFELYEEDREDLEPSKRLSGIKTVSGGEGDGEDADPDALHVRRFDRNKRRDGS